MPVKCYLDYCLPTLVVLFSPKVGYSGSVIFLKLILKMFIFYLYLYIQYYSVLFSDVQHTGQKIMYFTEWSPVLSTQLAPYIVIMALTIPYAVIYIFP